MSKHPYLTAPPPSDKMPGGIPFIVGNEAAERFSFYGMKAILFVFMTKYLMASDHVSRDVMNDEDAKAYVHLFVASAYFFPVIGAIISDWLFGKYHTILSLSIVYCLGHLALALDETRLGLTVGLTLIAIGSGGIKPCVSAHVGDQFGPRNSHLLSKVFGWFYFSINLGSFASTLLTPKLLEWYGPSVAFGVPGGLMLAATWVFWLGRHRFVHIPASGSQFVKDSLTGEGLKVILRLASIYIFVAVFWSLFDQSASAWVQQAESMDRVLGIEWLSSQIQAVNPVLVLVFIPLFSYFIYPAINSVFPLTPLRKISIGLFVTVASFSTSAYIEANITGGKIASATSVGDAEKTPASNLLEDEEMKFGWVSAPAATFEKAEKELFPQSIVIQLREHQAWKIDQVELNPVSDLERYFAARSKADKSFEAEDDSRYSAKDVEVFVGETPLADGEWTSVGSVELNNADEFTSLSFEPVETKYVKLVVNSNQGADAVALGKLRVNCVEEQVPAAAHEHAAAVWPNVAAIGFKPGIAWQLLAYALLTAAEIMVSITCLEFSYTQAPRSMKSLIMAVYLLSVSAGNLLTSLVNWFIKNEDGTNKLPGADYYWFFSGLMLATAVVFIFVAMNYRGESHLQTEADPDPPGDEIDDMEGLAESH